MTIRRSIFLSFGLLCFNAAVAFGQQTIPEDPAGPSRYGPLSFASEFFDNNYVNYSLFANGSFDTYSPVVGNQGGSVTGAYGFQVGGGVNAFHRFRRGSFGLSYFGAYQDYQSGLFSSGSNQNLNFAYNQRLGRRWSLSTNIGAGILLYGNGYYGSQPTSATYVQSNPFSSTTRFVSSSISMSYQLTRRLSFYGTGGFYLQRYSYSGAIGNTGGSGGAGASYRVTARTSVSGDYTHTYFKYQRGAGDASIDTISGSVFHQFPSHWVVSLSGGISHSNISGTVAIPLSLLLGQQGVGGYVVGKYSTKSNLPSFYGSVTHNLRHSSFTAGAGQSIVSGNGYYLASRNQYINGGYSHAYLRSNINAGVNYYRLKSVANSVSSTYNGVGFGVGYGYTLVKHIAANARYDFLRYGYLTPLSSVTDNRFSFGFSYSSKSIPLTFF